MDLLQRFSRGDLDAFETLFRGHQAEVYGWVVALVRDPAAAEDLTIEAFWRIYRARARFDPSRSFGAWARRVATNLALAHLHKTGREVSEDHQKLDARPGLPTPDAALMQETRDAIRRAFARLPAKLKAVAALALIEQKPHAEIAAALEISVDAVKSREFRAVRRLREELKEMGVEP